MRFCEVLTLANISIWFQVFQVRRFLVVFQSFLFRFCLSSLPIHFDRFSTVLSCFRVVLELLCLPLYVHPWHYPTPLFFFYFRISTFARWSN